METLPEDAIEELPDNSLRNMINEKIKKTQYQWHYEKKTETLQDLENRVRRLENKQTEIDLENRIRSLENKQIQNSTYPVGEDYRPRRNLHSYSNIVFDAIKKSYSNGINFKGIQAETRLNDRSIRNVIYKLHKKGIIIRKQRGIWIANENENNNTQPEEEEITPI